MGIEMVDLLLASPRGVPIPIPNNFAALGFPQHRPDEKPKLQIGAQLAKGGGRANHCGSYCPTERVRGKAVFSTYLASATPTTRRQCIFVGKVLWVKQAT